MSTKELKEGDKVMFLGIYDNNQTYKRWAKISNLVPLKVYTVSGISKNNFNQFSEIKLKNITLLHHQRYFQKIEEKDYGRESLGTAEVS